MFKQNDFYEKRYIISQTATMPYPFTITENFNDFSKNFNRASVLWKNQI